VHRGEKPTATLGTPLVTAYSYDADNNLVRTLLPNGTAETRRYDDLNRLTSIETDNATGQIVSSFLYALNPDGARAGVTDNAGRTGFYAYDPLGRLVKETILDPAASPRLIAYSYDLAGNRLTKTDTGGDPAQQSLAYTYDDNDRLLSVTNSNTGYSESYTYDANGSTRTVTTLTGGVSSVTTDAWDLQGRIVHVDQNGAHQIDYTYDDAGNRTSETVDGAKTTFLNDPNQAYDQVLEEYAPGGVLAATYVRGMDLLFQDRAGLRSYYAKDGLGSTRALTNSAGAVTDTYTYDASGDLTGSTGVTTNEFLYAGYQTDVALGQDYLRARYLDTAAGRFTSRDTVDGSLNDPVTQNHYLYASADPVDNTDPSGHRVLAGRESYVGKVVHTYLSGQFEAGGTRTNPRFGGREVSTIARSISRGTGIARNRLTPDAVEYNIASSSGDIYEFKHVKGDDVGNPAAYIPGILEAQAQINSLYLPALSGAIPGASWRLGTTWSNGVKDWGPINAVVPRTTGLTGPNDHLITVSDYSAAPGALLWASVDLNNQKDNPADWPLIFTSATAIASIGAAAGAYAYQLLAYNWKLNAIKSLISKTITIGIGTELDATVTVDTLIAIEGGP
jgi:RHS repeat-associated protein